MKDSEKLRDPVREDVINNVRGVLTGKISYPLLSGKIFNMSAWAKLLKSPLASGMRIRFLINSAVIRNGKES